MNPIEEAIQRLPGHWQKGDYRDPEGEHFCGLGMVRQVIKERYKRGTGGIHIEQNKAWDVMNQTAHEQYGDYFPQFNDDPNTTEADVIAMMEKSAAKYGEMYG